jgi:hypothetical protein
MLFPKGKATGKKNIDTIYACRHISRNGGSEPLGPGCHQDKGMEKLVNIRARIETRVQRNVHSP